MDKSWMCASRLSDEYANGVKLFIEYAKKNAYSTNGKYFCPCKGCSNVRKLSVEDIEDHLICIGFNEKYTKWIWHEELVEVSGISSVYADNEGYEDEDRLYDMIRDFGGEFTDASHKLDVLQSDAEKALWPRCTKYTLLSVVRKLFNLKDGNGWSDKIFTTLLEVLNDMFPEGNDLPKSTYEAKKILCPMGMKYKKIHACPNDYVLFRNEYKELNAYPICGASRYKIWENNVGNQIVKGPPAKVMWYIPIIPRFKHLFANPNDAKNLTWHVDDKICDGMLRHPTDSPQWKTIDHAFLEFGNDLRKLRLGLCMDGINHHGNLSSKHSSWPVMLVIYNLHPWLCMKCKYILLSLMISGPKQPRNDKDVFEAPLVEDLKKFWDEGVLV